MEPISVKRVTLFAKRAMVSLWLLCLACGLPPAAWAQPLNGPGSGPGSGPVTLNFKDADISAVIGTVSRATGKNFLIDPRVKGQVTIISSGPMEKEELYRVFLSILEVHGFAAVPSGNVIKIIPNAIAKQTAIPTHLESAAHISGEDVVTRIVQLDHVNAGDVVPLLKPLMDQAAHVASVPDSNILILSDRATNLARLIRVIRRIDRAADEKIEIIPLENALAADVVKVLNNLRQKGSDDHPLQKLTLIADDRTNSIFMRGEKATRLRLRSLIAHLDTPQESGGNTHVIYLRYAKAKDLIPVLTGVVEEQGAGGTSKPAAGRMRPVFNIQADEATNALVINAPPTEMRVIREVIDKLDIRRAQVLVEAIIAEVSNDLGAELGVRWQTSAPSSGSYMGTSFTEVAGLGTGFNLGFYRAANLRALLRVIANDTKSNVLSTPSLVTMDNEEAEIVVADNIPFITGEYTTNSTTVSDGNTVNPFRTIRREDVGLTLRVKPQINEGDTIKLEVHQEVSDVVPSPEGATDLTTRKRSIKTSVMVEDGQLIVLGGLIDDDVSQTLSKVPLLGDLPLLGMLFRVTSTETRKRNLMVFLHPRILRDVGTANTASFEKYNNVRAMQMELQRRGIPLLRDAEPPLLLRLEEYLGSGYGGSAR